MIWPEDGSPSSTVEMPTIIKEDNDGMAERVPRFRLEVSGHSAANRKAQRPMDCIAANRNASLCNLQIKYSKPVHQKRCRLQRYHR